MKVYIRIVILALVISLWACGTSKVNYSDTFKKIITTEQGVFRGVDFDTPISNVKKTESIKPELDDVLGLKYQIVLSEGETLYLEYDKQEDKVKNIRSKILLRNTQNAEKLYNELTQYYTKKHGKTKGKPKEQYWEVNTQKYLYYIDLTWVEKENTIYLDIRK
jgi:hypothetical protein